MSLRVRYVVATSAITLVTLGAASIAVTLAVNASQEHQLDLALVREAREEAAEADKLGGDELAISNRPGPFANDVGPLTKYAVIYGPGDRVIAQTPSWQRDPPPLSELPPPDGNCFDLWSAHEHLRAVHVDLPSHEGISLLLAAPRADLDNDARFLERTMATGFAVALVWTVLVALAVVHRLTRDHRTIAEVARRVAAGDLAARIDLQHGDREIVQLARDIDAMIERLGLLLGLQQRFVANAAHELRSPLTAVRTSAEVALGRDRSPQEYRELLGELVEQAEGLGALINRLLVLAEGDAGQLRGGGEVVPLARLAERAAEMFRGVAEHRGVTLRTAVAAPAPVLGEAAHLRQVVNNLIDNALKFTPAGGSVGVEVTAEGGAAVLRVSDTGPGIPPADLRLVFDRFVGGDRSRRRGHPAGGTGLGLSICRAVVHGYRGTITLDSAPGRTVATVRLPLAGAARPGRLTKP
jgi:two-component system heavy metal sensor histidine kinase CusS